jgi:hypothetical protein
VDLSSYRLDKRILQAKCDGTKLQKTEAMLAANALEGEDLLSNTLNLELIYSVANGEIQDPSVILAKIRDWFVGKDLAEKLDEKFIKDVLSQKKRAESQDGSLSGAHREKFESLG